MSDHEGKFRYYSNGCWVRSWNHQTMENGVHINGTPGDPSHDKHCPPNPFDGHVYPIERGMFALPAGDSLQDLFHLKMNVANPGPVGGCSNGTLLHTRIDIGANQGQGKVSFTDSLVMEGCFQVPAANRHANGRDWWLLLPDNLAHRFFRFLVTPDGIQGPWVQQIPNPTQFDSLFFRGWIEFSPNGERLVVQHITGTAVYDFDRCNGLLSNLRFMPVDFDNFGYGWSAAFSPDSRLLYVVRGDLKTVEQHDLETADVWASRKVVATWDGHRDTVPGSGTLVPSFFSYFQHGPDGKLYLWGAAKAMHIIEFPDRKGIGCQVRQRALKFPYLISSSGLYYPNYRLGPLDGSSCDTLGIDNLPVALFRYDVEDTLSPLEVTFTDLSYYEPDNWHWDFGDGIQSQEKDPVHAYALPGSYTVCLRASNANASDTFCRQVVVSSSSGIQSLAALPLAQVAPNPFSEVLRVQLPALVGVAPRFSLYDLLGREVHAAWLRDFDYDLQLSQLPPGMYVWQLRWNGEVAQSGRVVKR